MADEIENDPVIQYTDGTEQDDSSQASEDGWAPEVWLEENEVAMRELQGESQAILLNTIDNLRLNDIDADMLVDTVGGITSY